MSQTIRHKVATSLPPKLATALKNPWRVIRHPLILTTVGEAGRLEHHGRTRDAVVSGRPGDQLLESTPTARRPSL